MPGGGGALGIGRRGGQRRNRASGRAAGAGRALPLGGDPPRPSTWPECGGSEREGKVEAPPPARTLRGPLTRCRTRWTGPAPCGLVTAKRRHYYFLFAKFSFFFFFLREKACTQAMSKWARFTGWPRPGPGTEGQARNQVHPAAQLEGKPSGSLPGPACASALSAPLSLREAGIRSLVMPRAVPAGYPSAHHQFLVPMNFECSPLKQRRN